MTTAPKRRRGTLRERRTAQLKRNIIDCTIAIIAEGGVNAVTTAEVARRAQISEGSLFWHFRSRINLLTQVTIDITTRFMQKTSVHFENPDLTVGQAIKAFIEDYIDDLRNSPAESIASTLLFNEREVGRRVSVELTKERGARWRPTLDGILRASRTGEIEPIPMGVLLGVLHGAAQGIIVNRNQRPSSPYFPEMIYAAILRAGLALYNLDQNGNPIGPRWTERGPLPMPQIDDTPMAAIGRRSLDTSTED